MNFTKDDADKLLNIIKARRDVRGNRFISRPIEEEKLQMILEAGINAPSVGYSQPWKFIIIQDTRVKNAIAENFETQNAKAKEIFQEHSLYQKLKLEGIHEAPVNIACCF